MKYSTFSLPIAVAIAFASSTAGATVYPTTPTPITLGSATYTQNFDSLASTGSTGTALPTGWQVSENGSNANTSYGVDDGGNNAGNVYSYGTTGSTDRALGSLGSGSNAPLYYGAFFQNALGATITSLSLGYTGEQWRGGTASDQLVFQYSLNATSIDSVAATWISVASLAFSSPNASTAGALDGNATANRTALTGTMSGLTILNGSTFAIRWMDIDNSGSDDGLAVDDVRLTATTIAAVPEPATWAMLVLGFGLVGGASRYRRRNGRLVVA